MIPTFLLQAPSVSVIIPVHNEEKLLEFTLDSVLRQDLPLTDFEVIVALNGCTDGSKRIAATYPVRIAESPRCGMSFGKNLGAASAQGSILFFLDADTTIPPDGLRRVVAAMQPHAMAVAAVPGHPVAGGLVVHACFAIANEYARIKQVLSPGPLLAVHRHVFAAVGGFDESLPQGTSSDFIMRARQAGAEYVFVSEVKATTSIRRFEHAGIICQLLEWRRNHRDLAMRRRQAVMERTYEVVR